MNKWRILVLELRNRKSKRMNRIKLLTWLKSKVKTRTRQERVRKPKKQLQMKTKDRQLITRKEDRRKGAMTMSGRSSQTEKLRAKRKLLGNKKIILKRNNQLRHSSSKKHSKLSNNNSRHLFKLSSKNCLSLSGHQGSGSSSGGKLCFWATSRAACNTRITRPWPTETR